jgi:hypothetical protein
MSFILSHCLHRAPAANSETKYPCIMQQAPTWLPYRLRNAIDQARINAALKIVDRTRPYPAVDHADADAQISMLMCKRDLRLGVVALKSLLRFDDVRLAASFINDGTITGADRRYVDHHGPNATWQTWKNTSDPRLDEAFAQYPNLKALYFSDYEPSAKLMHPLVLGRCDRVVQYDSDTAFFARPDRIIEFCRGDDAMPLYLHDHQDESQVIPPLAHEAFKSLHAYVAPDRPWGIGHRLFNAGMIIYRRDQMDLSMAERYLEWLKTAPAKFTTGKPAIWFGPWKVGGVPGREQTAYHVMCALADPPARPLGEHYHIGGNPGHTFNHFLRHYIVRKSTLNMLRDLIGQF